VYFGQLVFQSDEQKLGLRGVKSIRVSSHPERDQLKSVFEGEKCLSQS